MRELKPSELRVKLQSWRKGLSASEQKSLSQAIDARLLGWFRASLQHSGPRTVWGCYRPLPWEWEIPQVLRWLSQRKVRVVYPRVQDSSLAWFEADPSNPAHWGANFRFSSLQEPVEGLPGVDPRDIYGVIVPGVAFSLLGERMGTGGGFYDRFLSAHPGILRVAVAAEQQICPVLPGQRPDEPRMHRLVSDRREFEFTSL